MPLKAPTVAAWSLLVAPFVGLSGCAVSIPTASGGSTVGAQGRTSHTLFLAPSVTQDDPSWDGSYLPEYSRRDAALGVGGDAPMLATAQWPESPRPDLDFNRYLTLPSQPGTYLYFSSLPYRYGWWGYRWDGRRYIPGAWGR